MALQAVLPPTDSGEFRRSALLKRLAASRARAEGRQPPTARRALSWDPAEWLGVSPPVMLTLCANAGVALGLLVYSTFQIASQAAPAALPQPASLEPGQIVEAEASLFVTVDELPAPAQAVDDYYYFLRQGKFDGAWDLTDDEFRLANYPTGLEAYREAWSEAQAMEVLSLDVIWQGAGEAHVLGVVQEGGTGVRWQNTYVVRFDAGSALWKIHAVVPSG